MLFFIESSFIIICSGSTSFSSLVSSTGIARHWLINLLTTSQCDNDLYFIHLRSRFSRKAKFMHSPRIGLGKGISLFPVSLVD